MITIHFCSFGSKDGRTQSEKILDEIIVPGKKLLYISPSGRRAEEAGKIFSAKKENREFYSLDRFIENTLKGVAGYAPGRYIDDKFKFILVQEILSSNEKFAALFNRSPGTISVLAELITDFKYYGFGNDTAGLKKRLRGALETYDKVLERALFAVEIFEKYQKKIRELRFTDDIDRLEAAAKAVTDNEFCVGLLVLDGFFDVPEAQRGIFTALIKASRETAVIHYGDERLDELKEIKSDFLDYIQGLGKCGIRQVKSAGKPRLPGDFPVHKALSIDEEVKDIAGGILKIKQGKKKEGFSDIVVTFPAMFAYIPYVKRIFPKYGIPFSTSVDMPFFTVPQVIPVTLLLRCLLEDFPRRTVVDIISSTSYRAFSKEAGELVSTASRKAGIVGGALQWEELAERLKNEEPAYYEEHKESILCLTEELALFFSAMEKLNKPLSLREFSSALGKTLITLKYSIKDKALASAFYTLLMGMETMLKVFKGKSGDPKENARLFMNILSRAAYKEESNAGDAVKVLGIMDTRGLYFKHLFFGGLADGDYPVKPKQEMIIPDKTRKELGLVHFQRKIELQKLHFYRLLQAPEETVHLSYPSQKNDKLVLMSNFLPESEGVAVKKTLQEPGTAEEKQRLLGRSEGAGNISYNTVEFKDKEKAAAYINSLFSGRSEISVTAIDRYLNCPFLFYLEKVLGLEILEEPKFEIESAYVGTILHDVMEGAFCPGKKDNEGLKAKLSASIQKELKKTLLHDFWKEHILQRMAMLQQRILKQEIELVENYPAVYCLEKKGRFKLPSGKAVIKGRIDRVDHNDHSFLVIDYKSGSGAKGYYDKTRKGESIQLPLYARMIAVERPDLAVGGFCVYDLKEGRARRVKEDAVAELYEQSLATAENAVSSILNGDFPKKAERGTGSCWGCPYLHLCK